MTQDPVLVVTVPERMQSCHRKRDQVPELQTLFLRPSPLLPAKLPSSHISGV